MNNTDPQVVENANIFAFYGGVLVIKTPWKRNAASFGVIFYGGDFTDPQAVLDHEVGHKIQLNRLGWKSFIRWCAIPSVVGNLADRAGLMGPDFYFNQPWEYNADELGGVTSRSGTYQPWADGAAEIYFTMADATKWIP